MTFLRNVAVGISERVVRWASPGCKEWAEGLEREVEFIDSDWRALGWALGSARVLLSRRTRTAGNEAPARPPGWRLWPIALVILTLDYWMNAALAHNWHDRIAAGLIAFGWTCWTTASIADRLWKRNEPPVSDVPASRLFRRATLQRRLEHYRSPRHFLELSIPICMSAGCAMNFEGWGRPELKFAVIVGAILAIWGLCLDTPAKIQQRIERMDLLIAGAQQQPCLDIKQLPIKRLQSDHWGRTKSPEPMDQGIAESAR